MTATHSNLRIALISLLAALGMLGLAFAAVPLYRVFCQVTGFGGTTQRAEAAPTAEQVRALNGRTINVRFDGNVRGLGWEFHPVAQVMKVKIGEQNIAYFRATNLGATASTGSATFNVSPSLSGGYFAKIQCFCFNEQTLAAGQTVDMPVVFYVDPAILDDPDVKDIDEITLSYTFFPVEHPTAPPAIRSTGKADIARNVPGQ